MTPVQPLTPLLQAQAMVAAYIQAEINVLSGKRVRIGGSGIERDLTHEDLNLIRDGRKEWERKAASLAAKAAPGGVATFGGLSYGVSNFSGHAGGFDR